MLNTLRYITNMKQPNLYIYIPSLLSLLLNSLSIFLIFLEADLRKWVLIDLAATAAR